MSASPADRAAGFRGPLFIVGVPRSGTSLVKDLLNRSPDVWLTRFETGFIPRLVRRHGAPPRLERADERARYVAFLAQSEFYARECREGRRLTPDHLADAPSGSWSAVLGATLRFYAPPDRHPGFVWGDKSPRYLVHLPLLRRALPEARFLHLVRDPRDVCLSTQRTWGRSLLRAAERWREGVAAARAARESLGDAYRELRFEDLLDDPEAAIRGVCDFAGVRFRPEMIELDGPWGGLGGARGQSEIVRGNREKFRAALGAREQRAIEELVTPLAQELGYALELARGPRRLSRAQRALLALHDGAATLRRNAARRGLWAGTRRYWRVHRYGRA